MSSEAKSSDIADNITVVNFKPKSPFDEVEPVLMLHSDNIPDKLGVIREDNLFDYAVRTERHDFRLYEKENYPYRCWARLEGHKYRVIVTSNKSDPAVIDSRLLNTFEESTVLHDSVLEHIRQKKWPVNGNGK